MKPWWHRPFRVYQSNIREIDAGLDVSSLIEHMRRLGANTWVLNAAGIVAFYPSELEYHYRSPWLTERPTGDLIGDAVRAAHDAGISVVARLDMSKINVDIADRHPDWCYRDRAGESPVFNGLVSTCPSGPYYQEKLHEVVDELLDRYRLDGIFLNWFHFTEWDYAFHPYDICRCQSCVQRFREFADADLPAERDFADPTYRRWKEFIAETMNGIARRTRDLLSRREWPIALVGRQESDIPWSEAGGNGVYATEPIWIHSSGDDVLEFKSSYTHRQVWLHKAMFVDMSWRFEVEQHGLMAQSSVQAMAHGGNLCAYQIGIPSTIAAGSFDSMAEIMQFHRRHEALYEGTEPGGRVGVVKSYPTLARLGTDEGNRRVRSETRGVTAALREHHIPFAIIAQKSLASMSTDELRRRYDLLVLPNVSILTDAEAALLDAYVEGGGNLVATAQTALRGGDGNLGAEYRLRSLGAHRVVQTLSTEKELRSAYLRVLPIAEPGPIASPDLLLLDREFLRTELRPGATSGLSFIPPSCIGPPEKIYWTDDHETSTPGLIWHSYGAGRTAYFPWPIGWLYYDLSLPGHGESLARAVRYLAGDQIITNAPPHVELTILRHQRDNRTLVHLINYSGRRGRSFSDPLPINELRVSVPANAAGVRSLVHGHELKIQRDDDYPSVVVPPLGLFDVLTVEQA